MKKAVIVLPTYNERENIKRLIPAIFEIVKSIANWQIDVLVVDDKSPDKTASAVRALQKKFKKLHLIQGDKKGLGNAYRRGFAYALKHLTPDILIEMDSDWQHDPQLIPDFLKQVDQGAEFVLGSRYVKGGSIPVNWALYRKFLSYIGNSLVLKFGFMNLSINDWTTGYRAIKADFIGQTLHKYKELEGYTFQVATLDNAIKRGLKIQEIPLAFKNRKVGASKINTFDFIIKNLLYIALNSTFARYAIVGFVTAGIDFGLSFIFIEFINTTIRTATVISASTAIVTNFALNNFWSFSHKKVHNSISAYAQAFTKFAVVAIGSVAIQAVLLELATKRFGMPYWYLYKALIIGFIIIPYSYTIYNFVIWKDQPRTA